MPARDEWEEIEPLLDQALELEGAALEEFLADVERRDPKLRRRLERYLGATGGGALLVDMPLHRVAGDLVDRLELERLDATLAPGRRIGAYEVLEELGEGGMGRVYLARRVGSDPEDRVALKVLNRSHLERQEMQRRFERERQILGNLEHPGIARLLDVGVTEDKRPYFALEYVEGDNLLAYCSARELGLEERVRLFVRVCEAVQYAHERGVIHRDLKPSNLMVAEDAAGGRRVCVLDFGIAREEKTHEITLTGQIMGTPGYMSPEQARGRTALVDHRADVFSLGVVLYELIGGRKPFDGRTPADVLLSLVDDDPMPLAERGSEVPKALEDIVLQCLAKDPADRYDSVAQLRTDLERFLAGQRPMLRRGERSARDVVRRFGPVLAVAAFAVVVLLGLGVAAWRRAAGEREAARVAAELLARATSLATEASGLEALPEGERAAALARHSAEANELARLAAATEGEARGATHQAAGVAFAAIGDPEHARRHLESALAAGPLAPAAALALAESRGEWHALEAALRQVERERSAPGEAGIDAELDTALAQSLDAAARAETLAPAERQLAAARALEVRGELRAAAERARAISGTPAESAAAALAAGDALLAAALAMPDQGPGRRALLDEAAASYRLAAVESERGRERLCALEIVSGATRAASSSSTSSAAPRAAGPCGAPIEHSSGRWQPRMLRAMESALAASGLEGGAATVAFAKALELAAEAVAAEPSSVFVHRARAALELLAAEQGSSGSLARVETAVSSLQEAVASLRATSADAAPGDDELLASLQDRLGAARLLAARLGSGAAARSEAELAVEALRRAHETKPSPMRQLALARACAVRAAQELGRGPVARDWVEQGLVALDRAEGGGIDGLATELARAELLLAAGRSDVLAGAEPVDAAAAAALARGLLERDLSLVGTRSVLARAKLIEARHRLERGRGAEDELAAARAALEEGGLEEDPRGDAGAELVAVELLADPDAATRSRLAREAAALAARPRASTAARAAPARVALAEALVRGGADGLDRVRELLREVLADDPHDPEVLLLSAEVHLARARAARSSSLASGELWRGIDAAERARQERPAWADVELLLAELHGDLAQHKTGAERREALRMQAACLERAQEINPLLAGG